MSTRPSPPLRPLIAGLGDSGSSVHVPMLRRLRAAGDHVSALFSPQPPVGVDPAGLEVDPDQAGDIEVVESLARAAEVLYPGNTVVHVCGPIGERATVLRELAERGFRLFLVDNPIAGDADTLAQIHGLAERFRLRVGVVAPWLSSGVTRRLAAAVGDARFGSVRRITVRQHQPRLGRTFASSEQTTALDLEPPNSIALALAVAGNGEVVSAQLDNTPTVDGRWVADMGAAALTIQHASGVVTDIASDLAAPMWAQRVLVEFESGSVECHYPLGGGDDYAHMYWRSERGPSGHDIFADTPHQQAFVDIYHGFVTQSWPEPSLRLHGRVVEIVNEAKTLCRRARTPPAPPPLPAQSNNQLVPQQFPSGHPSMPVSRQRAESWTPAGRGARPLSPLP